MSELGDRSVLASIPPLTRIFTLSSVTMAGLNAFGIASYSSFTCYFPAVFHQFEVYRLFTGFLIPNPQPMQGLMEIYMLYTFSKGLESGKFKRNLPDYIYYLLIILPVMLLGAYFFLPSVVSLSPALQSALTFTWSVANYDQRVNFYFMPIKASLLPPVSLGFRLLVDGQLSFTLSFIGMLAAYFYNCLETHSLGPLASLFSRDQHHAQTSNVRLGTNNNFTAWYYSTGELASPTWLRSIVSRITGQDYNAAPLNRGNTVGSGASGSASTSSRQQHSRTSSSSFLSNAFGRNTSFRGKGRRLGTKNE